MRDGFTKCLNTIVDSSLYSLPADVLKVFVAFWAKSEPDGTVRADITAMYRTANLVTDFDGTPAPFEHFEKMLNVLLSPDPSSRSEKARGKRIVRLAKSKWLIVNYEEIRKFTYSGSSEAIRKREYRSRKREEERKKTDRRARYAKALENELDGTCPGRSKAVPGHSASASGKKRVQRGENNHDVSDLIRSNLPDCVRERMRPPDKHGKGTGHGTGKM